jgi:5-methylthioadenosine/S-adenosylhomocysteine deaminase
MALRMATIESAKAIGLDHQIGSITKGKKADLILINLQEPNLCPIITDPIRNIVPNLVYAAKGNEVETVIIDGQFIMENRRMQRVDEGQVVQDAQQAANQIAQRARADIQHAQSDILHMMQNGYL